MTAFARKTATVAIVALGVGIVSASFFQAAGTRANAMRTDACRALAPDPIPPSLVGKDAPGFSLTGLDGKPVSLAALRGRPVVLNFWATWCAPCVEEMPALEALQKRLGDDATVLAVSVDEGWEPVRKFFANGTRLPVALDVSKDVPKAYTTEKYPETFIIDPAGKIRHYFINKRVWGSAEAALCVDSVR